MNFYVYIIFAPSEYLYVGKGQEKTRRVQQSLREKRGISYRIVSRSNSETRELLIERMLIRALRQTNRKLLNIVHGGCGSSGYRHPEEVRRALSLMMQGNQRGLGQRWTPEERQHLSEVMQEIARTKEMREKQRLAQTGLQSLVQSRPDVVEKKSVSKRAWWLSLSSEERILQSRRVREGMTRGGLQAWWDSPAGMAEKERRRHKRG